MSLTIHEQSEQLKRWRLRICRLRHLRSSTKASNDSSSKGSRRGHCGG
jgi:hypothetical protein